MWGVHFIRFRESEYNESHSCCIKDSGISELASCISESASHFKLQSNGMKAQSKQHRTMESAF